MYVFEEVVAVEYGDEDVRCIRMTLKLNKTSKQLMYKFN
jgi:hypothetical protein